MPNLDIYAQLDEMHGYIHREVAAGFMTTDEIIASVVGLMDEDVDTFVLTAAARRIVREVVDAHLAEQKGWPQTTDCDRLDAAFAALEESGIVCRQNFSCCGTCGSVEIWDEMDAARQGGRDVRGYAFYHVQDTDHAVEGDGLCLSYGSVEETEAGAVSVANDIVRFVERYGLQTEWNGKWERRIGVPLDWKRRRAA